MSGFNGQDKRQYNRPTGARSALGEAVDARPAVDQRDLIRVAVATPSGFLAFGLGSGLAPKAPGTAGTLMGMLVALPLAGIPWWAGLAVVAAAFVAGIWMCQKASDALGVHDHGGIVWDEFVGIWLVLALVPFEWTWWLSAFLVFRLFDVVKPWPIGWLDKRVHGGFGIMLDDLIAAVFAATVLGMAGLAVGGVETTLYG